MQQQYTPKYRPDVDVRRVESPLIAEAMAYAEDPYRELSSHAEKLGLKGEAKRLAKGALQAAGSTRAELRQLERQEGIRLSAEASAQRAAEDAELDADAELIYSPFVTKLAERYPGLDEKIDSLRITEEGMSISVDTLAEAGALVEVVAQKLSLRDEDSKPIGRLLNFDLDDLWRNKFDRPKKYHGGQSGRVNMVVRSDPEDRLGANIALEVEAVKDKEVVFVSSLSMMLERRASTVDLTTGEPLKYDHPVPVYGYELLATKHSAELGAFKSEHAANIHRGRMFAAAAMGRAYNGGTMSPR